jgi:ketosteroid isomerase-like protein
VETFYSQRGGILRRPMSQDDVEIVRRLYRALNARDFETIAELAHHDAEWIPDWRVGEGPVRGLENVIRFFTEQGEMLAEVRVEPERFWETLRLTFASLTCGPSKAASWYAAKASLTETKVSRPPGCRRK